MICTLTHKMPTYVIRFVLQTVPIFIAEKGEGVACYGYTDLSSPVDPDVGGHYLSRGGEVHITLVNSGIQSARHRVLVRTKVNEAAQDQSCSRCSCNKANNPRSTQH